MDKKYIRWEKRRKAVVVLHMLEAADILHVCFENLKDGHCNRPLHWENMASIASSTLGLPLGRPHLFASLLNKSFSAFSSVTSSGFKFYNSGLNAKTWMSSYHLIQQNMNDDDFRRTLEYELWIKWITIRYYKQYLGTTRITIWLKWFWKPIQTLLVNGKIFHISMYFFQAFYLLQNNSVSKKNGIL